MLAGMGQPEQVDVVVVGLGVGGEEAGGRLAAAGLSVVGIESRLVGGECPYYGCIPTKMMIRAGNALVEARRVAQLAGRATVTADWAPVAKRIREEATDTWNDKVAVDRFTSKGGRFERGTALITGPNRVRVGHNEYIAQRGIIVATGTTPAVPPIDGLAGTPFWTNREAVEVEQLPPSLVILGGGAIGVEFAQVFARFGVQVTVVEGADRLLAAEEPEAGAVVETALRADNVNIHTGVRAEHVAHDGAGFTVTLSDGSQVSAVKLLVALGRRAVLGGLGLEEAGVDTSGRFLEVDDRMRAGENVWAIGDVTGRGGFTHMAMYQADIAVRDILGEGGPGADYRALSRVTFTDPEVGAVGLTERQARERGLNVRVGVADVSASSRGYVHGPGNAGVIKVVEDVDRGVLVGATSAGVTGGEVLSGLAVAVHGEVPVATLRHMIYAYPTFHRAILDAVKALD